jgi:hypothetical protein
LLALPLASIACCATEGCFLLLSSIEANTEGRASTAAEQPLWVACCAEQAPQGKALLRYPFDLLFKLMLLLKSKAALPSVFPAKQPLRCFQRSSPFGERSSPCFLLRKPEGEGGCFLLRKPEGEGGCFLLRKPEGEEESKKQG